MTNLSCAPPGSGLSLEVPPPRGAASRGGACVECGCDEFSARLDEYGEPCHWVEPGLCSACAEPLVRVYSEAEASLFLTGRAGHG